MRDFWNEHDPGDLEYKTGKLQGGQEIGGRAPHPRGYLEASLTSTPSLLDCFLSKNNAPEGSIPFGLRLIFLFFEILKQAIKQQFWDGPPVNIKV